MKKDRNYKRFRALLKAHELAIKQNSLAVEALHRQQVSKTELLTTKQIVAKYFVSRQTVYRLNKKGLLPALTKFKQYYFDADTAAAFFANYWRKTPKK